MAKTVSQKFPVSTRGNKANAHIAVVIDPSIKIPFLPYLSEYAENKNKEGTITAEPINTAVSISSLTRSVLLTPYASMKAIRM